MKDNASTGYENAHLDIPGNPSTAKSSVLQLNQRQNNEPLNLLTEAQWAHWKQHGYVVIKAAVPKEQAQATADFLWEFEEKSGWPVHLVHPSPGRDEDERIGWNRNGRGV